MKRSRPDFVARRPCPFCHNSGSFYDDSVQDAPTQIEGDSIPTQIEGESMQEIEGDSMQEAPTQTEITVSPFNVIYFTETVERIYQYIDLRQEFRQSLEGLMQGKVSMPEQLMHSIKNIVRRNEKFNKLEDRDIQDAIVTVLLEIRDKLYHQDSVKYAKYKQTRKFESFRHNGQLITSVFPVLEEGRVMDTDPEVEIKKLKSEEGIVFPTEKDIRELTVTFRVPYCASTEDIRTLLTSAALDETTLLPYIEDVIFFSGRVEIAFCHLSSSGKQFAMAHVTFTDKLTATIAICLAANGQLRLGDDVVEAIPTSYNVLPENVTLPQNEEVESAMAAFNEMEQEWLVDARRRYSKLIEKAERGKVHTDNSKEPEMGHA